MGSEEKKEYINHFLLHIELLKKDKKKKKPTVTKSDDKYVQPCFILIFVKKCDL